MKRRFTLLFSTMLLASLSMEAQQIQGDFDKQTPWEKDSKGTTVQGWDVLNVTQMGMMNYPLTFSDADYDPNHPDGKSVRMECKFLGLMGIGSNSPSYMTLGKTWVYADIAGVMSGGTDPDDSDGGSVGGIAFTHRPDSIVGYYKRTLGTENPDESAKILLYSWKGTTSSEAPANLGTFADISLKTEDAPRQTLVDRDIDILGTKNDGKPADGITLISKAEYDLKGSLDEWTRIAVPIDYQSEEAPEKLNVIISSSNYFDRSAIGDGNTLWADNVRLIYNAKLKQITLGGAVLPEFDEDVFEYVLPAAEGDKELVAEAWGSQAEVKIAREGEVATITVTDATAKGVQTYTYKITFHGEATTINVPEQSPVYHYGDSIADMGFTSNNTSAFEYEISDPSILTVADGKLVALRPGTLQVRVKQGADETHATGVSEWLDVTVEKAPLSVLIKEGATCQRGMNANVSGKATYELELVGLKLDDASKDVSEIFTTMPKLSGDAPETEEKVGDTRIVTLGGGEAANYTLEFADNHVMTIVPNVVDIYVDYVGGGRFNSAQTGENYHTLKLAAGQDEYIFSLSYFNTAYNDKETLEGQNLLANLKCAVSKDAQVGEEFPVEMVLPEMEEDQQFKLNLMLPDDAKVVVAENPQIKFLSADSLATVTYGDSAFTIASCENNITYKIVNASQDVVSVDRNCSVTIKKAGSVDLIIGSAAKGDFGATACRIPFEVAKANLTITALNDTIEAGSQVPESFELVYDGFVYEDSLEGVFPTELPTAYVETSGSAVAGIYPIKINVVDEPENYNLNLVEGSLVVTESTGVDQTINNNGKPYYTNGCLYVPQGGRVSVYTVTGAQIGTFNGTAIPVALHPNTIYLIKTQSGVYRLLVK